MCKKLTLKEISDKSIIIYGDIYYISLDQEYKNVNKTILNIYCKKCDKYFLKTVKNHINNKQGCPLCSLNEKRLTLLDISNRSKVIHIDDFGNSKYYIPLEQKYTNREDLIWVFCKSCNEWFQQMVGNHLTGSGCKKCGYKSTSNKKKLKMFEIDKRMKKINSNFSLILDQEYVNINIELKVLCKRCNKIVYEKPGNLINGYGNCSDCDIEFDGIQHFEPNERFGGYKCFLDLKRNDEIKNNFCKKNDIELIRIKYNDNIIEKLNVLMDKIKGF